MQIPNTRILLMASIVLAILLLLSTLINGGGMQRLVISRLGLDAFADMGQKMNTFTMYYMNGCPHCESILPEFKTFVASGQVETNGAKTKIRMIEQGDSSAAAELEANNVKGFPTFILSTVDGKTVEYNGDRKVEAMKEFISQNTTK
jgi:hypothetical protein